MNFQVTLKQNCAEGNRVNRDLPVCFISFQLRNISTYVANQQMHTGKICFIFLYIKMNVCLYLIQIHISELIGTKLCTHLPRGLEETVGYVWAHNISPFPPFRHTLSRARGDSYAVDGCRRHTASLLRYIRDAARAGVTSWM